MWIPQKSDGLKKFQRSYFSNNFIIATQYCKFDFSALTNKNKSYARYKRGF